MTQQGEFYHESPGLKTFVFIYTKDGKIKVLSHYEAQMKQDQLIAYGWTHTATLDACKWIEWLHNNASDKIKEINDLHNTESYNRKN